MKNNIYIFILSVSFLFNQEDTSSIKNISIKNGIDSTNNFFVENDLFETLLSEAKMFYAEAIISDLISDTLNAMYGFDNVFKALAQLEEISENDELDKLKYQQMLTAVIEYYDNKVVSIDHSKTGFSTAVFNEKVDNYIYSQNLEDLVNVEETVEFIEGHLPITYNKKVQSVISYYKKQGKTYIQQWLNREKKFKEIMLPILKEEGLPLELFYIPMIESGLRTDAKSFASAVGPWQFIASTGKAYGLKKTFYIDERRDFEKSTRAAAKYLKHLYNEFGDWYLAFAAYNGGETRLHRHLNCKQCGYPSGKLSFWDLDRLPKETQNYVPSLMAIIFISKNPEKYGFKVNSLPSLKWEVKKIDKSVKIDDIAKCAKIDKKILLEYNPEILREYILVDKGSVYDFRMPINCSSDFDSLFSLIKETSSDEVVFKKHKVKKGESLWSIAIKYGSTITAICEVNKLNRNKPIRIGKVITVPVGSYKSPPKKVYYTVKKGDTLSEIAVKYRTSVSKIKRWNGLRNNLIYPGKKLVIHR